MGLGLEQDPMLENDRTEEDLRWMLRSSRPPKLRSIAEFAEQEIVIPDGPHKGERFKIRRQPYVRLWFEELKSGRWRRHFATGPTQSGKSLSAYVIPTLYHLFELEETVVCGLPDMDMAADKWREDFKPAIEASRYKDLLPRDGAGSRGGKVEAIKFRNGATLKFMSAGGNDKARAGFTARVLVITETDGMDKAASTSREADPIAQLEGRLLSFGSRALTYAECTVSVEKGRTWQEYTKGSKSRIVLRCPVVGCGAWVTPEREHLVGWQDAKSEKEARAQTRWMCPACGVPWSEEQRHVAHLPGNAKVLHGGQEITREGEIVGPLPDTETLGFRWTAVNNMFLTAGDVGVMEWKGAREVDEENAEKQLKQFFHVLPHAPDREEKAPLDVRELALRMGKTKRYEVPDDSDCLTGFIDVQNRVLWWLVMAWNAEARGTVVAYGSHDVPGAMENRKAVLVALRQLKDKLTKARTFVDRRGDEHELDAVLVDSGNGDHTDVVYAFVKEGGGLFWASKGYGIGQEGKQAYTDGDDAEAVHGLKYKKKLQKKSGIVLVHFCADFWKSWVHQRLTCSLEEASAIEFYQVEEGSKENHMTLARHLTAEKKETVYIPPKGNVKGGNVTKWTTVRKSNHLLDCLAGACVAGHMKGVRTPEMRSEGRTAAMAAGAPVKPRLTTEDGRPFLITER